MTRTDEILWYASHGWGLSEAVVESMRFKCKLEQLQEGLDDYAAPWGCACGAFLDTEEQAINHVFDTAARYDDVCSD